MVADELALLPLLRTAPPLLSPIAPLIALLTPCPALIVFPSLPMVEG